MDHVTPDLDAGWRDDAVVDPGAMVDASVADAELSPPVSQFCGDAIRDDLEEECDDGPGTEGDDSCTADCRRRVITVVESPPGHDGGTESGTERRLGSGAHTVASHRTGLGVIFTEGPTVPGVYVQRFDQWGRRIGYPLAVSEGALPTASAEPAVAVLSSGHLVTAWSDRSLGGPDIAMRSIDPHGEMGEMFTAHRSTSGPQVEPDLLRFDHGLVVAWSNLDDVFVRRFDDNLSPTENEAAVATTEALDSAPALAAWGDQWAVSYRSVEQGQERIRVIASDGTSWWGPAERPAPQGERPALLALDAQHLLLVFTAAFDDGMGGTVTRLRATVLGAERSGEVPTFGVEFIDPLEQAHVRSQRRASLAFVNNHVFLAWEVGRASNETDQSDVVLQRLRWEPSATVPLLVEDERLVPTNGARSGAQSGPMLSSSPLRPSGALVTTWHGASPYGVRDLWIAFEPMPLVELQ